MGNLKNSMQDQPLTPLLYVEHISEKMVSNTCRQFNLKFEEFLSGYLIQNNEVQTNFKISYLDLFFATLRTFSNHSNMRFLLFEKNHLREELEHSILGSISQETMVENKIREWKKRNFCRSLSGFAQTAIYQAGFISTIESEDIDLNSEQLNKILDFHLKVKVTKVA